MSYKEKYNELKNMYKNVMNKSDENISFPNGFPDLKINGDYHIIHEYDKKLQGSQEKQRKLDQVKVWIETTFPGTSGEDDRNYLRNDLTEVGSCYRIYEAHGEDLKKLIDWLNDPKNN